MKSRFKIMNWVIAIIMALLWILLFCAKGTVKEVVWCFLTMALPLVGVIWITTTMVILIINVFKRKNISRFVVAIIVGVVMCIPGLFMLDVIPVAYPISLEKTEPSITVIFPLKEETIVGWGGDNIKENKPHGKLPSERSMSST